MTEEQIRFYQEEKLKFNQLLNKLGWTEVCLLNQQEKLSQCPLDRNHRFPIRSKHLVNCQLIKQGFSKDDLKELAECEQQKQLLNQSGILLTSSKLSAILHRPVIIPDNIPLSIEQTTVLFTPEERATIAQAVHNEAVQLGIVPSTLHSVPDHHSTQSHNLNRSEQSNKSAESRDQKRRRTKYVTRTMKKSFYDVAREMINSQMELIQEKNSEETRSKKHHKKRKHHSSHSRKHDRRSKKHRKS